MSLKIGYIENWSWSTPYWVRSTEYKLIYWLEGTFSAPRFHRATSATIHTCCGWPSVGPWTRYFKGILLRKVHFRKPLFYTGINSLFLHRLSSTASLSFFISHSMFSIALGFLHNRKHEVLPRLEDKDATLYLYSWMRSKRNICVAPNSPTLRDDESKKTIVWGEEETHEENGNKRPCNFALLKPGVW